MDFFNPFKAFFLNGNFFQKKVKIVTKILPFYLFLLLAF